MQEIQNRYFNIQSLITDRQIDRQIPESASVKEISEEKSIDKSRKCFNFGALPTQNQHFKHIYADIVNKSRSNIHLIA